MWLCIGLVQQHQFYPPAAPADPSALIQNPLLSLSLWLASQAAAPIEILQQSGTHVSDILKSPGVTSEAAVLSALNTGRQKKLFQ